MSIRVSIVCTDGDMFSMPADRRLFDNSLEGVVGTLSTQLEDGKGISFEAFGRRRVVMADDIESVEIKRVRAKLSVEES